MNRLLQNCEASRADYQNMSMQTGRFQVNRNLEKALLDNLLQPAARQRILLLQASSGYGKSYLSRSYRSVIETAAMNWR